ncbi:hypothetical protein CVT26_009224 [Gymnopilus dilepis]|uniref:Uncharacterized protein n=1 Tax=Gymnopilus dilepis TaxID=231916 RepID=A0A409WCB7_9AGAR|nr:hypothetical protein CVT26_009224 [Gymnopilus dilepis]
MCFLDYHRTLQFEDDLLEEQRIRSNMTSFKAYPFPGELIDIPYPIDKEGNPIPPDRLAEHSTATNFNIPYCFHGRRVEIVVRETNSTGMKLVTLVCGARERGDTKCRFYSEYIQICSSNEFNAV